MQRRSSVTELTALADRAVLAARAAGTSILNLYRKENAIDIKSDGSPLTLADQKSHQVIVASLLTLGIPIISEEAEEVGLAETRYWLVDPLDGTKDSLVANDEFTVNISLIEEGRPIIGILYAPALDELYVGIAGSVAWCEQRGMRTSCRVFPKSAELRMAASRFHDHPDAAIFAKANRVTQIIPIGAALKYGRLAMGEIDVYPRVVGTSEWDTAAGQAVLEAVGGTILDWHTRKPMRYGKSRRRNGRFLAFRAPYQADDFDLMTYSAELL